MGQGDLEECEAHGGSGKVDSRCEKEGDEEHRGIFAIGVLVLNIYARRLIRNLI